MSIPPSEPYGQSPAFPPQEPEQPVQNDGTDDNVVAQMQTSITTAAAASTKAAVISYVVVVMLSSPFHIFSSILPKTSKSNTTSEDKTGFRYVNIVR